jgi:DNA-dependent RNA polymerase auxiliary subunit epsilon
MSLFFFLYRFLSQTTIFPGPPDSDKKVRDKANREEIRGNSTEDSTRRERSEAFLIPIKGSTRIQTQQAMNKKTFDLEEIDPISLWLLSDCPANKP